MSTYIFPTAMQQEDDGRWSAWIEALPGCTAWGQTREEALNAIRDAAEAYLADMREAGDPLYLQKDLEGGGRADGQL